MSSAGRGRPYGPAWPDCRRNCTGGDTATVSIPAAIGFTVCLLIGDRAYGDGPERVNTVTIGVLLASTTAPASRRSCSGGACTTTSTRRMMSDTGA
ncbi:Na+/H+ antiporter NhaA [Streptosporangium sp. NPDC003464]